MYDRRLRRRRRDLPGLLASAALRSIANVNPCYDSRTAYHSPIGSWRARRNESDSRWPGCRVSVAITNITAATFLIATAMISTIPSVNAVDHANNPPMKAFALTNSIESLRSGGGISAIFRPGARNAPRLDPVDDELLGAAGGAIPSDKEANSDDADSNDGTSYPQQEVQGRIIGGTDAEPNRYPYAASLVHKSSSNHALHVCGGTLIAPDVVLSAAHCAGSFHGVVLGRHDLSLTDDDDVGETYEIAETIVHPGYAYTTYNNDIGNDFLLIKLGGGGTSTIEPVALNPSGAVPVGNGAPLTVIGWGSVEFPGFVMSPVLQEARVDYVTNGVCQQSSGWVDGTFYSYWGFIKSNMMCASGDGRDACQGDSGGPIVVRGDADDGSQDVQVGIVSFGVECAHPDFPGIYARVSDQIGWLKESVCELSDYPPEEFDCPTAVVTQAPTSGSPSANPSANPSSRPSLRPSLRPSSTPSEFPTTETPPSAFPSALPTLNSTAAVPPLNENAADGDTNTTMTTIDNGQQQLPETSSSPTAARLGGNRLDTTDDALTPSPTPVASIVYTGGISPPTSHLFDDNNNLSASEVPSAVPSAQFDSFVDPSTTPSSTPKQPISSSPSSIKALSSAQMQNLEPSLKSSSVPSSAPILRGHSSPPLNVPSAAPMPTLDVSLQPSAVTSSVQREPSDSSSSPSSSSVSSSPPTSDADGRSISSRDGPDLLLPTDSPSPQVVQSINPPKSVGTASPRADALGWRIFSCVVLSYCLRAAMA